MAEPTQFLFDYKEVVEALIRKQGLNEGIWQLIVTFNLAGINIGPQDDQISPAAVVRIAKLGLMRVEKETSISVDAAKVNPKQKPKR